MTTSLQLFDKYLKLWRQLCVVTLTYNILTRVYSKGVCPLGFWRILCTLKNDVRATRKCQHPEGLGFHRTTMEILFVDNNPQQANSIFISNINSNNKDVWIKKIYFTIYQYKCWAVCFSFLQFSPPSFGRSQPRTSFLQQSTAPDTKE